MLKNNLNNKLPLIYRGEGTGNHAFLCHGYRDDNLFCFNWGNYISNYYNEDFFTLDDLTPYHEVFSYRHAAIFNIHPPSRTDICENNLILDDFYSNNFFIGFPFFYKPYDITPKTSTVLTSASIETSSSWRTIPANATAVYQAHEEVILRDGFAAERGCDFTARIEPCVRCEERDGDDNADDAIDMYTQDNGEETPAYAVGHPSATDGLYPNPTDGQVTVAVDATIETIVIHTTDGRPLGGWKMLALAGDRAILDVSSLPDGLYLLYVRTSSGTKTYKLSVTYCP